MEISLYTFWTALGLGFLFIPPIISVAHARRLFAVPHAGSVAHRQVPVLGGIGILSASLLSLLFWTPDASFSYFKYIFVAAILLFLVGVWDDLVPISPWKKIMLQIAAAGILVFPGGFRLEGLYGLFGLTDGIGVVPGILLSFVVILGLINAMNFIDGIDGLLSGLGVVSLLFFGGWFYLQGDLLGMLAFSTAGALLAFLLFNYPPAQIFMGDTGSLFIGLNIAVLVIAFLNQNEALAVENSFKFHSSPAVVLGVLAIPIADFVRVCVLRLLKGKSPMRADRCHIHHLLIDLGLAHRGVTIALIITQIALIALVLLLDGVMALHNLLLLLFAFIGFGYWVVLNRLSGKKEVQMRQLQVPGGSLPSGYQEKARQTY